jgi:DNA repair protein RecN (Recombination protein N)
MLKKLVVKNFAILEDIEIDFYDGLTILTGETGAGKSLIIDSISLLLGERASVEMIRNGEEKALISGIFSFSNIYLESFLNKLNIQNNGEIEISRTISSSRNVIKVNGVTISLNDLKVIAHYLADIHLQFDMTKLLNKENYIEIVDGFKKDTIDEYKNKYLDSLNLLKEENDHYLDLLKRIEEIKNNEEQYKYDLKELKSLALENDEENNIKERIAFLNNYDKIYSLIKESEEIINKDALSDIYQIKNNVNNLSSYQNEYKELYERINNAYYEIEDIFDSLNKKSRHFDYDPKELEDLEIRLSAINSLKKKHNKTFEELLIYQEELESILSKEEDYTTLLNEEKEKLQDIYDHTYSLANDLSKVRKEIAKLIEKESEKHLLDLGLKSVFEVRINSFNKPSDIDLSIFNDNGIDDIDFYIETNIGEGLKPLAKIASGGEVSRIMLAFKALTIKSSKVETVIFDEIDTGISGEVASKVARKIYEISLSTQVISITHLPQVAALSKNHLRIAKEIKNKRTYTSIKYLSLDEKIYEIASLISGGKVSEKQLEYAKEMVLSK